MQAISAGIRPMRENLIPRPADRLSPNPQEPHICPNTYKKNLLKESVFIRSIRVQKRALLPSEISDQIIYTHLEGYKCN